MTMGNEFGTGGAIMEFLSRVVFVSGVFAMAMVSAGIGSAARGSSGPPTVFELFTSQGCSSCPPADNLLATLARRPDVIAMSFPVDYWDYIGWKDTLASPAFTARQKAYAEARGDGHVYTPQVIVDGLAAAVGSDWDEIERAMADVRVKTDAMTLPIRLTDASSRLRVEIPAGTGEPATIYVLRVERSRTVKIGRGENAGHSITYTNVVRAMNEIGQWTGAPVTFEIPQLKGEDEGYIVLVQRGSRDKPGMILAAAKTAGL